MEIGYSYQVQQALMHACEAAEECCNASVGTEHLLIGILKIKEAKLTELLKNEGVTDQTIAQEVQILFGFDTSSGKRGYTSTLNAILKDAQKRAQHKHEQEVSIDELSASLLERENNVALELLRRSGIVIEQLVEQLNQTDAFYGIKELKNLNQSVLHRKGKVTQREKEIESMIRVLMRMEKSNCVLTGPAGVGKSAIVEELAYRIEKKQVPEQLQGCTVAELNVNQMVAGTKYRGEFEKKIHHLLEMLHKARNIILFIDELHLIVGAGKAEGSLDIASVLKPVLARRDIKVIGATTDEEYDRWIMKDKALQRRFVRIEVCEPDEQMTLAMLKEKAKELSNYHDVKFQRGLLKECIQMADRMFPSLKFPDKAIDLLDMSCSAARCSGLSFVTVECLHEAASRMSQIPLFFHDSLKCFLTELKAFLSFEQIEGISDSLKQTLKRKRAMIWDLKTDQDNIDCIKENLQKYFQAEIHEMDAALFDSISITDVVRFFSMHMGSNRFHVFWIGHAECLRSDVAELLRRQSIDQLALLNDSAFTLKGALTVLNFTKSKHQIGFFPETDCKDEIDADSIRVDESQALVVS